MKWTSRYIKNYYARVFNSDLFRTNMLKIVYNLTSMQWKLLFTRLKLEQLAESKLNTYTLIILILSETF